ncbi:hypothetical protein INR49_025081 [Caranx melampygus]|nr:hypothetical protein INR49_025081 [Caranx melampygus]
MTSCIQPTLGMEPLIQMAAMRRRFVSVCSSSKPEEDTTDLYDCAPISASDPLSANMFAITALHLERFQEKVIVIQIMVGIVQQWIEPIFQRSENSFSVSETQNLS